MLGARPPRRRAGAVVAVGARAGDAVEAAVRRAGIRRRVGPQARQPRLDTREAVSRIVAFTKEPDLLNTQEPREGGGVRAQKESAARAVGTDSRGGRLWDALIRKVEGIEWAAIASPHGKDIAEAQLGQRPRIAAPDLRNDALGRSNDAATAANQAL